VDKPLEWTSHQVVAAVRNWSHQRRIGHAGTLDPLATGVLLLCLGKATRVSPYLMASTKVYRATLRLGLSTTTHDAEGEIVAQREVDLSRKQFESVLPRFLGRIDQVPPAYSAVKRQGKRLYEYARQGVEVKVPPRTVEIHSLSTTAWRPPLVALEVACGPGTYVRALARDLGQALGCGASLVDLRRVSSGQFHADQAIHLPAIEQAYADARADAAADPVAQVRALIRTRLHPLDRAFAHLPAIVLDAADARRLTMGQGVEAETGQARGPGLMPVDGHSRTYNDAQAQAYARAYGPGQQFLALVAWHENTERWRPRKVFTQPSELL
jgi:tRNA pseudouridine55 synthase